jgi:hypothetical protein
MSHSTSLIPLRPLSPATCQQVAQQDLPLTEHLPADLIHSSCRRFGHSFRNRVFTPAVTLWTFLTQLLDPDHSCRQAVARLLAFRVSQGLPPCSADTGGYCKARARLPEEVLQDLTRSTGADLAARAPQPWLWKGRPVKVVDGTGLSMPDTPANQNAYPQPSSVKPGLGFPLVRLVVVFSLAVGTVLDAAFGPWKGKGTGELSLFRSLGAVLTKGDVLLADRLYSSFWEVWQVLARGADVVTRLHGGRRAVWFRGSGQKKGNRRVWWRKPPRPSWMTWEEYDEIPRWIRLRALKVVVRQRGFRTRSLVLITTLRDADVYRADEIADLYRRRWQAELNLRSLKRSLKMDELRGQSPEMVRKEIWGHLLAYNVVRAVMAASATLVGVRPDEVSFTGALQTLNAFASHFRAAQTEEAWSRLYRALLGAVGRHRVGNRPDRYEPRARKRGGSHFPRLKETRKKARKRLERRT